MLYDYQPNTAVHPGRALRGVLGVLGMSQRELAERMQVTVKHISEILQGKSDLSSDMAIKLELATDVPASYWLNYQKNHDEILARQKQEKAIAKQASLAVKYPVSKLAKLGWIPEPQVPTENAKWLCRFFGVADLTSVPTLLNFSFRISATKTAIDQYALSAWIRKGEIEAGALNCAPYDRARLQEVVEKLRRLTGNCLRRDAHYMEVKKMLSECGVALVVLPYLSRTNVNGATKWLTKDKAMVLLSDRYKKADITWFTLLHEIYHVLNPQKKAVIVSFKEGFRGDDEEERAADRFAADQLIPKSLWFRFKNAGSYDKESVIGFARKVGVHTGIVVGRLQHESLIGRNRLNDLRVECGKK